MLSKTRKIFRYRAAVCSRCRSQRNLRIRHAQGHYAASKRAIALSDLPLKNGTPTESGAHVRSDSFATQAV
jgi:hypothetical protein